jgi:5-methylcytosine-specific restriction endonuclease McrA
MEREQLKDWLERGLSLAEIGARTGRDASTVGYWVRKHGLVANGRGRYAPRGGLPREQLESLVDAGMTLAQISERVERSISTVRYWLGRYGLQTKVYTRHRAKALEALGEGLSRFVSICRYHGETEFVLRTDGGSRCARCSSEAVARRRRKVKRVLVEEAGGRCALCGYDRYHGAMQFHHVRRAEKAFMLSKKGSTISLERARAEASKCVLLCSNCHAEVEGGIASLTPDRSGVAKLAAAADC